MCTVSKKSYQNAGEQLFKNPLHGECFAPRFFSIEPIEPSIVETLFFVRLYRLVEFQQNRGRQVSSVL